MHGSFGGSGDQPVITDIGCQRTKESYRVVRVSYHRSLLKAGGGEGRESRRRRGGARYFEMSGVKTRQGPYGVLMFERDSGLNILFDELAPPASAWSLAPRTMSFALTNACDLRCSYCYAPKQAATLDLDRLKGWLKELDENGCLSVGFGGGEPMLYPHLAELFELVRSQTSLACTMTSHGHLITESKQKVLDYLNFLRISVDGTSEVYEANRGRKYAKLLEVLGRVSGRVPFGLNFLVNNETIDHLEQIVEVAERFSAREILLLPQRKTAKCDDVDSVTLARLKHWILNYAGRIPLAISEQWKEGLPASSPFPGEHTSESYMHVSALGELKLNSFEGNGLVIGRAALMVAIQSIRRVSEAST